MAARKSRPVLYELIAQSQQTASWTRPAQSDQATRPQIVKLATTTAAGDAHSGAGRGALPGWIGRRVSLELSMPYMVAIGAVAIVLIALAFYAGRESGGDKNGTSAALEQALTQKPGEATTVDERPRAEPPITHRPSRPVAVPPRPDQPPSEPARETHPAPPAPEIPAQPEAAAKPQAFESGKAYVIVQHLSKRGAGPQAAERIRDFLTAGGVPCVVHSSGPDLVVVATEPFAIDPKKRKDAGDPERKRAQQLMDRIRKLGEQYVTSGYTFKDCYLREF
jgi:hypothetical protein